MGEETVVQAAQFAPEGRTGKQTGAADPEHAGRSGIILPLVFFRTLEHASAAERETETVHEASCGTGILEAVAALVSSVAVRQQGMQLGAAYAALRVRVHIGDQRLEPARSNQDVGVYQQIILRIHLRQSPVVSAGKAVIGTEGDGPYRGEIRRHTSHGTV